MQEKAWHAMEVEEVIKELNTSVEGLSEDEAKKRLGIFGRNELEREEEISPLKIFIKQFKQLLIIILIIATIISAIIGEVIDAIVIIAIVIAASTLGFVQEYRSEKAMEALRRMTTTFATVLRDGQEKEIPSPEVVPGDILVLATGNKIAADARIIEQVNLQVNEAALTGESEPVRKSVERLDKDTPLADRKNMLFSGTLITYGKAKAVVVATGMNTEFGKIAKMLKSEEQPTTPLERRMSELGKFLTKITLVVVAAISILGIFRGHDLLEMFLWGISLAVAAVPEALPAVVTGSLAIGMRNMAKQKALVRRLPAVETLGSITIICSDKTGTLTKGEMTVRKILIDDEIAEVTGVGYEPKGKVKANSIGIVKLLAKASALCNDAKLVKKEGRWDIIGDPTEGALVVLAEKLGMNTKKLAKDSERIWELPFSSERKRMTTVHKDKELGFVAFTKGAPEIVLDRSSKILTKNGETELKEEKKKEILKINEKMASEGLRVLGVAYRKLSDINNLGEWIEEDLIFLGLIGMMDPPREEAKQAVKLCKQAGIKVVMITGDHKLTAEAVAKELGILEDKAIVLTGKELDEISDDEFKNIVEDVKVYARVSPTHKLKIVKALKERGHVVAMTGDGVNDAPALKSADIGVAMGITGTDVTKEASDMILSDDNFVTIVNAVREGRRIFDNVKKYLTYLLSANIGEVLIMGIASIFALPLPLLAKHILYMNLVTDGLPAIALGVDPAERDVMNRPPRKPYESIFKGVKGFLYGIAILITIVTLFAFWFELSKGLWTQDAIIRARTMAFTTICFFEICLALSLRSFTGNFLANGFFTNKFLLISLLAESILLILTLQLPLLREVFSLATLSVDEIVLMALLASTGFLSCEIGKFVFRRLRH